MPLETVLINLALGFGFGFTLERAGFGDSRRLAGQFYFHDQTVLKVMFTAIVWCMLLLFWSTALGWIEFSEVFVNPTYLGPAIVGGLLVGIGFIVGGYCPGTSVVAASTGKVDGAFFLLGLLFGVLGFSATFGAIRDFWESSGFLGRLTLFDWLGVDAGLVVLAVVVMAIGMFAGAEWLERRFRRLAPSAPSAPAAPSMEGDA